MAKSADNNNDNDLRRVEVAFVEAYLGTEPGVRLSKLRSYMRAKGMDPSGKAERGVKDRANRLFHSARVQAHLSAVRAERGSYYEANVERVLHELAVIAFSDLRDYGWWDADKFILFDSEDIPDELAGAISAIRRQERCGLELRLWPKTEALKILAKYYGMDDDFNTARRVLRSYGIALLQDDNEDLGWRIEKVKDERP